ncbi:MAG: hypothetical protein KAS32_30010 [Candidatus Peribacteraceae bacterium]|nr:hypothetical protein [Candidatus Peribacteraceae bacterium]
MNKYVSEKYIEFLKTKKQNPLKMADDAARAVKMKLSKDKKVDEEGSEEES